MVYIIVKYFLLLLVPGLLVALPDIEIQQGRRLYTNYKVLRAHLTSDTDRAAVLQLEDGKLGRGPRCLRKCKEVKLVVSRKVISFILDSKAEQAVSPGLDPLTF